MEIGVRKNYFALAHVASHCPLLAGGIGVTPIRRMAERLVATAARFEMHYCTRSREDTAFYERNQATRFAAVRLTISTTTMRQEAKDQFTPCCSRSKSTMLVLDS